MISGLKKDVYEIGYGMSEEWRKASRAELDRMFESRSFWPNHDKRWLAVEDVLGLIKDRQSVRGLFDPDKPIARGDLRRILEAGSWAPTAHNMQNFEIVVVDDKRLLDAIGSIEFTISEAFLKENYEQMSFSEEELRRRKTGILSKRFPAAMQKPDAKPEELRNESLGKAIRSCAALLVITYDPSRRAPASEGDFLGIISLGCVMENIWLMAHSLGIGLHVVSSISNEGVEDEVKRILAIPERLKIAFSCRLGFPVSERHEYFRVRRDVEDFTYFNRYGSR